MKSGGIRWWVCVPAALLIAVTIAYLYFHSGSFRQTLASKASDALGHTVELSDNVSLTGLLPLSFEIPSVRVRFDQAATNLQRARFDAVQMSISPGLLFGKSTGEVSVLVQRASFIAGPLSEAVKTNGNSSRDIDINNIDDTVSVLLSTIADLAGVTADIGINDMDIIVRNGQKANRQYRVKDAQLDFTDHTLSGMARLIWDDLAEQQLSFRLGGLIVAPLDNRKSVSATLNAEVLPSVGRHSTAKLSAKVGIGTGFFELAELDASNDRFWIRGDTSGTWDKTDVRVQSEIEVRRLELATQMAKDNLLAGVTEVNNRAASGKAKRLFTFDLFGASLPMNLYVDLIVHLGAVRLDAMPIANGGAVFALADGVLQVTSDELYLLGGEATLSAEVDNTLEQLVSVQLKLSVDDLELERIRLGGRDESIISRGTSDAIIAIKGEGPSPGHIASSLDGYVLASISEAQVNQKYSTLIDKGIVSWALEKVSVLSAGIDQEPIDTTSLSDPLDVECASLRVYINDGRVEVSNGAIMEFSDNTLFSSGFIDLASEKLGFAFRTRSRGLFDLSAISIIKYAEVSGSLVEPRVALNATELAKQGVKSASSAAWGPLPSLVYSLAEAGLKNANASECQAQIK